MPLSINWGVYGVKLLLEIGNNRICQVATFLIDDPKKCDPLCAKQVAPFPNQCISIQISALAHKNSWEMYGNLPIWEKARPALRKAGRTFSSRPQKTSATRFALAKKKENQQTHSKVLAQSRSHLIWDPGAIRNQFCIEFIFVIYRNLKP